MMDRPNARLFKLGSAIVAALMPALARAQTHGIDTTSRPFRGVDGGDLARAWIDYLFRGEAMPDAMAAYTAPLSFAAEGLRQALALYSVGVLLLAAMLVFYHLAAMVVETAQTGVPFGRRANQIWMPIRFVLAIGFLVPVSSSLSSGQYLVLSIAGQGSALASNAWHTIANATNGHLSGLAMPRGPNVAQFAATAIEMEVCRSVYQQLYTPLDNDTVIHLAGTIGDMTHLPSDRFIPETWLYTNQLNASVPLCGAYRFDGFRRPLYGVHLPSEGAARMAEDLSDFAHTQATDTETQAKTIGDRTATAFLSPSAPIGADVHSDVVSLEDTLRDNLETERRQMAEAGDGLADQVMANSTDAGWIAAANFIPEFVRLQTSYSELIAHALPTMQGPVFAHQHMTQKVLADAVSMSPAYEPLRGAVPEKLLAFYNQNSRTDAAVRAWLIGTQLPDNTFMAPSSADLTEQLSAATDPDATSAYLTKAFDAEAIAHGVWGEEPESVDTGYPFATVPTTTINYNPFAALVEFGRRQTELASSLANLAGSGLSTPGAAGPSVLFGLASLVFFLGGILLVFVIPLLPFLRFLLAALTWILHVFEAIVAVPIVALAHLTPVGGGLSGSLARQAYVLWLSLLVRPILILLGFVFGLLVFTLSLAFLDAVLTPFARLAVTGNGGLTISANMGLVIFYDVLAFAAANVSFRGIHWLPENALRWTSQFVVSDANDNAHAVGNVGTAPGLSAVTAFLAPGGGGGGSATQVNVTSATTVNNSTTTNNAMTAALFPAYGEATVARDLARGATTSTSSSLSKSTTTHLSDHSPGGGGGQFNVNITGGSGLSGMPGSSVGRGSQQPKSRRVGGGENETSVGGKERGASAKDEIKTPAITSDIPKPTPTKE